MESVNLEPHGLRTQDAGRRTQHSQPPPRQFRYVHPSHVSLAHSLPPKGAPDVASWTPLGALLERSWALLG
eukprot:9494805-Pyramimonas_sp.AAC.2